MQDDNQCRKCLLGFIAIAKRFCFDTCHSEPIPKPELFPKAVRCKHTRIINSNFKIKRHPDAKSGGRFVRIRLLYVPLGLCLFRTFSGKFSRFSPTSFSYICHILNQRRKEMRGKPGKGKTSYSLTTYRTLATGLPFVVILSHILFLLQMK